MNFNLYSWNQFRFPNTSIPMRAKSKTTAMPNKIHQIRNNSIKEVIPTWKDQNIIIKPANKNPQINQKKPYPNPKILSPLRSNNNWLWKYFIYRHKSLIKYYNDKEYQKILSSYPFT